MGTTVDGRGSKRHVRILCRCVDGVSREVGSLPGQARRLFGIARKKYFLRNY